MWVLIVFHIKLLTFLRERRASEAHSDVKWRFAFICHQLITHNATLISLFSPSNQSSFCFLKRTSHINNMLSFCHRRALLISLFSPVSAAGWMNLLPQLNDRGREKSVNYTTFASIDFIHRWKNIKSRMKWLMRSLTLLTIACNDHKVIWLHSQLIELSTMSNRNVIINVHSQTAIVRLIDSNIKTICGFFSQVSHVQRFSADLGSERKTIYYVTMMHVGQSKYIKSNSIIARSCNLLS